MTPEVFELFPVILDDPLNLGLILVKFQVHSLLPNSHLLFWLER